MSCWPILDACMENKMDTQWLIKAIWESGILVWAPKLWHPKNFQVFSFQLYFNKSSNHLFHSTSNSLEMALKTKMQKEEKNETKTCQSKWRNCLQKCFHLFKYVIDHANVHFFFLISLQTYSQPLNNMNICTASRNSICTTSTSFQPRFLSSPWSSSWSYTCCCCFVLFIVFAFFLIYNFFKNHQQRRISSVIHVSNLENVMQRNLRTHRAREYIFRVTGDTNFENYPLGANSGGNFLGSVYIPVYAKKTLDPSQVS